MEKPINLTLKLSALVLFAVLFAATLIALSVKDRRISNEDSHAWGDARAIQKTFAVGSGGKLVIDADVGDITISGTEGEELSIQVLQKGSDEQVKKYHVTFDQNGNTVTVKGRHERKYFHFFDNAWFDVRFVVELPKSFNLDLQTSGGNLNIENVNGTIVGETSGGDVEVEKLEGDVRVTTSGGNVRLSNSRGELTFETSGGDVVGEDLEGKVHVETSGGNITIKRTDATLYGETSGGDIRVELRDNKGVNLSTSGGNVVVNLPKGVAGDVDAETSGGDVSCDFAFSGKLKDGSMHGQINGGGERIRLGTSGGDIIIHATE